MFERQGILLGKTIGYRRDMGNEVTKVDWDQSM